MSGSAGHQTCNQTNCDENAYDQGQRGQASIALVAVLALAIVLAGALAMVAQAMVHRARARSAADAIALATVIDPQASRDLTAWYVSQGVTIERHATTTISRSGPSQAAAWASSEATVEAAPALRAIVARAEQLVGRQFVTVQWSELSFRLTASDSDLFRPLAVEFGLCVERHDGPTGAAETFELC